MSSELYRQIVTPTAVAAAVMPLEIYLPRLAARYLNGKAAIWVARLPAVLATLFLLLQLHFMLHAGFSSNTALVGAVICLGGIAACLIRGWRRAAWALFGLYLFYWLVEKYLVPFGLSNWLAALSPRLNDDGETLHWAAIVGISYIGFKLIHFVVDFRNGDIENPSVIEFLNWMFFFPSIIAGPMQRYQDWQQQRAERTFALEEYSYGVSRIMIGLFLKFVLADTLRPMTLTGFAAPDFEFISMPRLLLGVFGYTVYIYFDFAGYSHIAIGAARFWGIRLPENFRAPFLARNLAEFWNRWHITLSEILRDYLFYPMSLSLKRTQFGRNHPNFATVIPPLVTFVIAGIWHGAGINFALFGLMHGIGLAWLALIKRRRNIPAWERWWQKSKIGQVGGAAINFCYVSLAFVFFALPADKLLALAHRLSLFS